MLMPMKADMYRAQAQLQDLLEENECTAGMDVRAHGDHLIVAREATVRGRKTELEDRVRLTRLASSRWGLSIKRHTGRWERTPFSGSLKDDAFSMAGQKRV